MTKVILAFVRTLLLQLPIFSFAVWVAYVSLRLTPFADDRLDLEFWNALGDVEARRDLALYLEARHKSEHAPLRVVRLYFDNASYDPVSAARYMELIHEAMLGGNQPHVVGKKTEAQLADFVYFLGQVWMSKPNPPCMRVRAFQLVDREFVKLASRHFTLDSPAIPDAPGPLLREQRPRIMAGALLLAASRLDGRPAGDDFRRLDLSLSTDEMAMAKDLAARLVKQSPAKPMLTNPKRISGTGILTLALKSLGVFLIAILITASILAQLGAWVVLGASFLRHLMIPCAYLISPIVFVTAYDVMHDISRAKPSAGLATVTGLVFVGYIWCLYLMQPKMTSLANVRPSEI